MNHRDIGVVAAQHACKVIEAFYPELFKQMPLMAKQWEHELGRYFHERLNAYLAGTLQGIEHYQLPKGTADDPQAS